MTNEQSDQDATLTAIAVIAIPLCVALGGYAFHSALYYAFEAVTTTVQPAHDRMQWYADAWGAVVIVSAIGILLSGAYLARAVIKKGTAVTFAKLRKTLHL